MQAGSKKQLFWRVSGAFLMGVGFTALYFHAMVPGLIFGLLGLAAVAVSSPTGNGSALAPSRLEQVREHAALLCRNLPSGMLLMDQLGRVLFANEQALRLFGRKADDFHGSLLASLADTKTGETQPGLVPAHRYRRADGTLFYAHISEAPVDVPGDPEPLRLRILIVSDITAVVDMQRRLQQAERLRTAATMATQFAHEVRNPVAAISGSAQVLEKLQRNVAAAGVQSGVTDHDRATLYQCIVSESDRLDGIIAKFLSVAEFSDERLEQLLHLPELGADLPEADYRPKPNQQPQPSHAA